MLQKTDSDENCPSQLTNSPSPPQTEPLTDSKPSQAEPLDVSRPAEFVSHPPQPIGEVNILLSPACSSACFFYLLPACLYTASVTLMMQGFSLAHSWFRTISKILYLYCLPKRINLIYHLSLLPPVRFSWITL